MAKRFDISTPEGRSARARHAARVMHQKGKTNTAPARKAFDEKFASEDERRAYFSGIAKRRWGLIDKAEK